MAQAFTNIDGPLLRSFRSLLGHPGALTVAYLQGRRKQNTLPLQIFLVANVLFFAMQSLTGAKIFSTPLDQHLHSDIWGGLAQQLAGRHVVMNRMTLEAYSPVFNQAVALNAKSLVFLMVLPFALLASLTFWRSRRPFVAHVVFSLHFYAFLLLLLCVSLAAVWVDQMWGGAGLASVAFDHALSIAELAVCAVYLYIAMETVYGAKGFLRVLQVALLVMAAAAIFLGYRFALFLITLYST